MRSRADIRKSIAKMIKGGMTLKEAAWELKIKFKTAEYHWLVARGMYRPAKTRNL